ncbi:MAG TPA: pantoate kinase [Methanomassiliicoccales archaeon]|nr:pantoate kinase [Methanomassiliicoccales archaeon]
MKAQAFCPGHITGFFQICEHGDIAKTGSRGAGICIGLGANSTVKAEKGKGKLNIKINGKRSSAPVTRQALAMLMDAPEYDLTVETQLELPMCQGFGMSAAGTLSSALALCEIMGYDFEEAIKVTHHAEVLHRTGLGDVAALSRGGITFRRREGLPPFGRIDRINKDIDLAIAVVGPEISTSNILGDPDIRERINHVGEECVSNLERSPSLANFFRLCGEFSMRTGLITPEVENALESISGMGPAAMVMLGNSVFASGDVEGEVALLSERWDAHKVSVDWQGPRILDSGR